MALTARKAAFVAEYAKDLNATQAAIRAGYSERTAKQQGSRLLTDVDVVNSLQQATSTAVQRVEQSLGAGAVTLERVIQEYARIAFADMRRFAKVGPDGVRLVDSEEWTDDDAAAVAEVSESTSKDGGSIRFKLHNKVSALDSIAKHLGMFVERHEVDVTVRSEALLAVAQMTPEQLRELAERARG